MSRDVEQYDIDVLVGFRPNDGHAYALKATGRRFKTSQLSRVLFFVLTVDLYHQWYTARQSEMYRLTTRKQNLYAKVEMRSQ